MPLAGRQKDEEGISLHILFFFLHPVPLMELFAKRLQFQHSGDPLLKDYHLLETVGV